MNNTRLCFKLLLLALLGAVLMPCLAQPSSSDGERIVQIKIKEQSEGRIRLVSFLKTNDGLTEEPGSTTYTLKFFTEIEFTENCRWVTGPLGGVITFLTTTEENVGPPVTKGQRAKVFGVMQFGKQVRKKEVAWTLDLFDLSRGELGKPVASSAADAKPGTSDVASTRPKAAETDEAKKKNSDSCRYNLINIGAALRMWSIGNGGMFPFHASTNDTPTGTLELCSRDKDGYDKSVVQIFQTLSAGLGTPKILVCPSDSARTAAADFKHLPQDDFVWVTGSGFGRLKERWEATR